MLTRYMQSIPRKTQLCAAHTSSRLAFLQQAAGVKMDDNVKLDLDIDTTSKTPDMKTMKQFLEKLESSDHAAFMALFRDFCSECLCVYF